MNEIAKQTLAVLDKALEPTPPPLSESAKNLMANMDKMHAGIRSLVLKNGSSREFRTATKQSARSKVNLDFPTGKRSSTSNRATPAMMNLRFWLPRFQPLRLLPLSPWFSIPR